MGRASRKKNRLRDVSGGVYSKMWNKNDYSFEMEIQKTITILRKGGSVSIDGNLIKSMSKFIKYWVHEIVKESDTDPEIIIYSFIVRYLRNTGKYHNFFITDNDTVNFIENQSIKNNDYQYLPNIMNEYCPTYEDELFHELSDILSTKYFAGAMHFVNRKYSIMFALINNKVKNFQTLFYYTSDYTKSAISGMTLDKDYRKSMIDPDSIRKWNSIFNLFLYIDAFPEAVKTGPPPIKHLDYVKSLSNTTINAHESIKGLFGHHVSPHLRRGHYRFLKSDRYKNKQFQTVFVRPTMVKGTADHIIDVTKKEKVS